MSADQGLVGLVTTVRQCAKGGWAWLTASLANPAVPLASSGASLMSFTHALSASATASGVAAATAAGLPASGASTARAWGDREMMRR